MKNHTDFFESFETITEEQWQEFAFASVKDVKKLVRKNQSGMSLKPLYTQNDIDKLEQADLLGNFSQSKTLSVASVDNFDDYKQARQLGAKSFLLKLNNENLRNEEFYKPGTKSENLFVEFLQNPHLECKFWERQLTHYQNKYYLYDPITFSIEHRKQFEPIDGLKPCVDASYFSKLGISDLNEISHALLLVHHYLQDIPEDKRKSAFSSLPIRVSLGSKFFQNIAKLRAFNLLLQRYFFSLFNEAYHKDNFLIIATASHCDKLDLDLHTNILRETTANMSAQLCGVSFFQNSAFDSSSQAKRLALNSFTIIKEECFSQAVDDPAAGSYYLESLTDQYAQQGWQIFNQLKNTYQEQSLKDYFFEGEFFDVCKKDQLILKNEIAIGKTHFENKLDSCLNRDQQDLKKDNYWDVYDHKNQEDLSSQSKPGIKVDISEWSHFKELLGFQHENLKLARVIDAPLYQKGDKHE